MQCGWWIFGLVWFLAVATAMLLCVSGVLPMPLRRRADTMGFDAECPFGPWVFIANLLAFVVTPIVVPYLPESLFPTCFLDAWTILQRFALVSPVHVGSNISASISVFLTACMGTYLADPVNQG